MKYLSQFSIIMGFSLVGEVLQRLIPLPIPASVYGIILLFCALQFNLIRVSQVKDVGDFLSSILPILFVAPTVGILEYWAAIRSWVLWILLLVLGSTLLTFGISGRISQILLERGPDKDGSDV